MVSDFPDNICLTIAAFVAAVWNFTGNRLWTFSTSKSSDEEDYEWHAWYNGNPIQRWWKRKIGHLVKDMLGSPEDLLDVGCGSSPVINLFGSYRLGLEGSRDKIRFMREHSSATFEKVDLEEGFSLDGSYDGVICSNVLEHLQSPEKVVKSIGKHLSVGGHAVITVPDMAHPLTRFIEWIYGKLMPGGYANNHVFTFTPGSLDAMFSKVGLTRVDLQHVMTDMVVKYQKGI